MRVTVGGISNRFRKMYPPVCRMSADNPDAHLWNISWLKEEYQQIIQENGIFNESVYEVVEKIIGPLSKENSGIIFTVPVDSVKGLTKNVTEVK